MNNLGRQDNDILEAALRQDLVTFIHRAFIEVVPGSPFALNWHIEAIAYALEQVLAGKTRRLLITIPPRSLKSICASVAFPAWALGHDPTRRIIAVSYGDELAGKHALDCRRIIDSPWYRRVFPETRLSKTKNTETEYVTTKGGYRYSTSVGGALTGRGGNLIIIDDPVKPGDVLSDTKRNTANSWYDTTLYSRLDNKVTDAIILVMQRLHLEDLVGHVLEQENWVHLNIPAIAEVDEEIQITDDEIYCRGAGELLHAEREPLELLEQIRRTLGSYMFSAQYQQRPIPVEGSILQWKWFRRYETPPRRGSDDFVIQSWDPAAVPGLNNDFSVCTTWLIQGNNCYLLNVFRRQLDYPDLKRAVLTLANLWKPFEVIIERANTGVPLIQELQSARSLPEPIRLRWTTPKDDKVTRMAGHSARIEGGEVFLPREAPWLKGLHDEIVQFPHGRYSDQIDSLSQFLHRLQFPPFGPRQSVVTPIYSEWRKDRDWPRRGFNFGI